MRLVTRTDVNIRSGPSMVFEVVDHAKAGTELNSFEYKKDAEKNGWYHVDKGWVCANYVTNAPDAKITNPASEIDLKRNAIDVSSIASSITSGSKLGTTNTVMRTLFGTNAVAKNDILLKKRAFGLPYQFRESVDLRTSGVDFPLGVDYLYAMSAAPYVSIVPGKPLFLPDVSDTERDRYFKVFNDLIEPLADGVHMAQDALTALNSENVEIKYFGFQLDYVKYIRYVNTMCWMMAIMLGISDKPVPGFESLPNGEGTFGKFDWSRYRLSHLFAGRHPIGDDGIYMSSEGGLASKTAESIGTAWDMFWSSDKNSFDAAADAYAYLMDQADKEPYYTDFYINPNVSYSETFSNSTSPSMVEGLVNQASDMAKEIGFLLSAGINDVEGQENLRKTINQMSQGVTGGNGILSRLLSGVSTIISGSNIAFPEIWKSSEYSRSYNIDINLKTPYGTKESIFMDILVPMAHWVILAAPRMQSVNTYGAPFLVKSFIPGFCSIDMGIVENLTITKGGDGSAWSVDGLPLEMNLSISIKDLYHQISTHMINFASPTDIYNFIWNTGYMDYLSVQCGLNMKQSEAGKKLSIIKSIVQNQLDTKYIKNRIEDEIGQALFAETNRWMRGTIFSR